FGCCLPCPQPYYLYPSGYMEKGFEATQVVRALSAFAALAVMLSFLVLPGRRSHPSSLILFASISIFLYSATVFFSIGNPKKIQCVNDVTPSTQDNNGLCAVQGALLIFTSHATAFWTAIIILNLHMHTVWNSNFMANKYLWLHLFGWGIPTILTVAALVENSVAYQFAGLCLIKQEAANAIFFYPLAVIVVPSCIMHSATFFHIAKASRSDSGESSGLSEFTTTRKIKVLQAVKIQWRALLLAVVLVVTVFTYWIFYFIELRNITDGPKNRDFLTNWLNCVQSNGGQNGCSKIARGYMPPYPLIMITEFLASLIGIWLLAIFSNSVLWKGWG
ncbi:15843_t:CDS:2, partial [Acaulospora morrowiae]